MGLAGEGQVLHLDAQVELGRAFRGFESGAHHDTEAVLLQKRQLAT